MRGRGKTVNNSIQSSIAINQKKNNSVIGNAMKIMNNALIERLRDREEELDDLRTVNAELLEQIEKFKKKEELDDLRAINAELLDQIGKFKGEETKQEEEDVINVESSV
jgi:predicted Mrr-cat superfamily restriction endonuclease